MRTFYKQSLGALFATALAFGCGSSDQQQQQAKEPQTSTLQTTGATTEGSGSQGTGSQGSQGYQGSQGTPQGGSGMGGSMQGSTSSTTPPSQPPGAGTGGPQDTTTGTSAGSQNADESSTTTTMPATMDTKVTTLSDGEVLAVENALNKGEISLAELARKHAVTADVKSFAGSLLTHHRDALNKSAAIARKEKIVAKDDDVSKKLQMDATTTAGDLQKHKGRDFDSSYIDSQVRMHRDAGTLIDSQLLPSVKNSALKDQLTSFRKTISDHLTKAEEIQSQLEVVGTTSTTSGTMKGSNKAKGQGHGTSNTKTPPPKK